MKSKLYKISQENFETIIKYYNSINSKIKIYYDNIIKYKKYTEDYCSKIKNLFNDEEYFTNNGYEIIEIDDNLNNHELIKDKIVSSEEKNKKKINISPIINIIELMNKFFNEYIQHIQLFMVDLSIPLKSLDALMKIIGDEMNSLKDKHLSNQKDFISKYNEFLSLNKNLKTIYASAEESLVDFYKQKKDVHKKDELEKMKKNLNLSLKEKILKQNEILGKYNSLGNFENSYNEATKEEIKSLKYLSSSLFQQFELFKNSIYTIFKGSFMTPMEKFLPQKEIDVQSESIIKKKFDNILDSYIQKIEDKDIQIKFDEYKIRVTEKNEYIKTEIFEKGKLLKRLSFEVINNVVENDYLNEEEIFNIASYMFDKFILISQANYDLKIEGKKLELNKIIEKLTSFESKNKEKKIKKEEVNYLCKYMNNKIYQKYFLMKINKFRESGIFSFPKEIFDYFVQIFSEISNNIFIDKKEDKIIIDVDISRLIIILSRTFFYMKDGKKEYIQNEINNNKIFHYIEFWKQLIKSSIENEIKNVSDNYLKIGNIDDEKSIKERNNNVVFAQVLPNLDAMNGFKVNKEDMKNIVLPFLEEYDISDKNKQTILDIIGSYKQI